MPTLVEIPEVGQVEFPDSMNQEEIAHTIRTKISPNLNVETAPTTLGVQTSPDSGSVEIPLSDQTQIIQDPKAVAEKEIQGITSEALQQGVNIPVVGQPGTFTRGASSAASSLASVATSPEGLGILAAQAVPVVNKVVNTALLAVGAKQTAQDLGEFSVTGNPETLGRASIMGAATGLGALGLAQTARALTERPVESVRTQPAPVASEQAGSMEPPAEPVASSAKGPGAATPEPAPAISEPTPKGVETQTVPPIESPVRENGGRTSLVLSDGTAIVGGKIHAQTYDAALERGLATEEQLASSKSAFTRPDGTSWDLQGNPVEVKRVVNLSEATATEPPKLFEVDEAEPSVGPGAASPSDFPKESQLKQLTGAVKGTEPVKVPIKEQLKQQVGSLKEQIQSGWERGLETLKQTGQQALEKLRGVQEWTDFRDALGKFVGERNRNDYDLLQFTRAMRKAVPDKLRREAIVNWIQADGDTALLQSRAAASNPARRPGYEVATKLTPDEMVLADNVRSYLDAKLQEGIDAGLLKSGIENYISQVWDRPNPVTTRLLGALTTGKLQPNFRFARQRLFESYFEGEQLGYKPKIKDVGGLIAAYDQAFSNALRARQWLKAMHEGKASDGRPLVEVSGVSAPVVEGGDATALLIKPKVKPHETGDYLAVDHPAMQGWKWAGSTEEGQPVLYQGNLLVHPEVWDHVKNVLSRSRMRQYGAGKMLLELQSLLKQSKLALSGFHFTQEGVHALAHRVKPLGPDKIDFTKPDQSALVDHGLQVASYDAQQAFSEGLSGRGSIYEKIPVAGKWLSRYNEYLFQEYIPRLKMTMALHALERNRGRFAGKISDDQILDLTARQSNAAFGELNYEMMGRNPTFQDIIRLGLLAPDFLEARVKFGLQAFTKYGTEQRVALALQAATMYAGARLINQWVSGDPHWDKPFSIFANNREYGLRSVVGDIAHAVQDPGRFIGNRLAPFTKAAIEFATGRDFRGVKRTHMEQLADLFDWLKPITFDRRGETTLIDQAAAASGITVRSSTATQRVYELLGKFKQDKSLLTKEEKEGLRASSDYAQLRTALQNGNMSGAADEYEKLLHPSDQLAAKTPQQIRKYFVGYAHSPLSGSTKIEHQFVQSLSDKDKQLYLEARKEKRDVALKFMEFQKGMNK